MTEEEAKTKWCPFVREGYSAPVGANRYKESAAATAPCIASSCMAWRWKMIPLKGYQNQDGISVITEYGTDKERGFCGLAGKP